MEERIERIRGWKGAAGVRLAGAVCAQGGAMHRVLLDAIRLARTGLPLLIRGESGSGKELVANVVHAASRARGRLVAVNSGGLPSHLAESELFGHERGAFTGAVTAREGAFEAAHGGTVFLDEVGELSPDAQAKLLRVLEVRAVRRVGSTVERPVDFRLVAATHRSLSQMARTGRFRADLRYRLDVLRIVVPPLRDRREDLPLLVPALLARQAVPVDVTPGAMAALGAHDWPGNVRELRNVLARAAQDRREQTVTADSVLRALEDDPPDPHPGAPAVRAPSANARVRLLQAVQGALAATGGNVRAAAQRVGVPRTTVYRWLRQGKVRRPCLAITENPAAPQPALVGAARGA